MYVSGLSRATENIENALVEEWSEHSTSAVPEQMDIASDDNNATSV